MGNGYAQVFCSKKSPFGVVYVMEIEIKGSEKMETSSFSKAYQTIYDITIHIWNTVKQPPRSWSSKKALQVLLRHDIGKKNLLNDASISIIRLQKPPWSWLLLISMCGYIIIFCGLTLFTFCLNMHTGPQWLWGCFWDHLWPNAVHVIQNIVPHIILLCRG